MSTLTLTRDSSAYQRQYAPAQASGTNPAFLHIRRAQGGSNAEHTIVNFSLPAILLDPLTEIASAQLVVTGSSDWPSRTDLIVGLLGKSWNASNVTWGWLPPSSDVAGASVSNWDGARPAGTPFHINVAPLLELVRAGRPFYGFRISSLQQELRNLRNNDSRAPYLQIEYTRAPNRPSVASPVDGQVVDNPAPVLKLTQVDPSLTTINAMQVQTSKTVDVIDFDSGAILTTETQVDLSKTAFTPLSVQGETCSWRGRLRGTGGKWSQWTDWVKFTYETLGQVQILDPPPAPNNAVYEQRPTLKWTNTGFQQEFFRAILYNNATKERLWDSGWIASREQEVSPPAGFITVVGQEYKWEMWATDGLERTLTGNNEAYAGAERAFRYELASDIDPIYGLTAEDMDPLPFVRLRWARASRPEQYEIVRDGRSRALLDVEGLIQPDGTYAWVDPAASPRRSHTWTVRAVTNGRTSASNPTISKTIEPAGVWLCDLNNGEYVTIVTDQQQTMALSEDGGTFTPLNARYGIRVTTSLHGYGGTIVGEILKTELTGNESGQSMHDRFLRIRERKSQEMSLILADAAYRIVPFNMTIAESPQPGRNGDYVYPCSFDFIQVGS